MAHAPSQRAASMAPVVSLTQEVCVLALTAFRDGCSVAEVLREEEEEFSSTESRAALYSLGAMIDKRRFLAKHAPVELQLETADGEAVVFSFPPLDPPPPAEEPEPALPVSAGSSSPETPSRQPPSTGSPPSRQRSGTSRSPLPSRTPPPRTSPRLRGKAEAACTTGKGLKRKQRASGASAADGLASDRTARRML